MYSIFAVNASTAALLWIELSVLSLSRYTYIPTSKNYNTIRFSEILLFFNGGETHILSKRIRNSIYINLRAEAFKSLFENFTVFKYFAFFSNLFLPSRPSFRVC